MRLEPVAALRPVVLAALLAALGPLVTTAPAAADPRPREPMAGGELAHALHRLQTAGSALYVAAHPDDENTALLAWLTHVKGVRSAYLSMTRGDGGQNLIGPELGPALGVIRTQELLAARRMDGAEQLFTRALDFGFSKHADETLRFWEHDSILGDVVYAIRRFQPDVIITRFPPDSTAGHGHHTASAMLAEEAFAAAADPQRYPEQLTRVQPWQAKRLLWNVFSFGRVQVDSTWLTLDVGAYDPLLGRSMSELAGLSRSNHKSQGFGAAERRGSLPQYLMPKLGAPATRDAFEGVDLSWKRFPGGEAVSVLLAQAEREFDARHPEQLLPVLAKAHAALAKLPATALMKRRREELEQVMASCAGLWLEAVTARPVITPGEGLAVATSVLVRTPAAVTLESVRVDETERLATRALVPNVAAVDTLQFTVRTDLELTQPYWLRRPSLAGRAVNDDPSDLGNPENRPALLAEFVLRMAGERVRFVLPVAFREVDRVQGERWRLLEISPPAVLAFEQSFQLFADAAPRTLRITVSAQRNGLTGSLKLDVPSGWSAKPAMVPVAIAREGQQSVFEFVVVPGREAGVARAVFSEASGRAWSLGAQRIDHEHIPVQTLFPPAELKLVRADVGMRAQRVGYVAGSGDQIAEALSQLGAQVTSLSDDDIASADLSRYDAIVTGVRAYNTRPRLRALQPRLLDYVAKGGRLLVQYATSDAALDGLGPLPFRISRDRVTVEEAAVRILKPMNPLVTEPNKLGPEDFVGWVQERGLYFANPYDPNYEAVLGSNDPGEPSRDGGLLYAKHGSGEFVYCGYALFRQVPAGVPGAWRLLANLVSSSGVRRP